MIKSAVPLMSAIKSPIETARGVLLEGLSLHEQSLIDKALTLAEETYGDRVLPLGERIMNHVLGVARQASVLGLDAPSRLSALLSRVPNVLPHGAKIVQDSFGEKTFELIHGLEKLRRLDHTLQNNVSSLDGKNAKSAEAQAEALRKMLLVLSDDMRMVVLKLVSRIQTLQYIYKHPTEAARDVANVTLQFFAPLANRLGMYELKWPLEDWSFRILEPNTYQFLAKSLSGNRAEREKLVTDFLAELSNLINPLGIRAEMRGRAKHLFSIHRKMQRKNMSISELYDLNATRVLVDDVEACYRVLAQLHEHWRFVQNEFDDYIARPKDNGYQSLHTVVVFRDHPIEVQIRTHEMHRLAESGVASHWRYKEGVADDQQFEERLKLLRELMIWQKDIAKGDQRLKLLTEDTLYCLTPKGEVFDLPQGATPVDFAYRVHSELGHRCRGAKVDGVMVPLTTSLRSGQCVDIVTTKEGGPSRDWLLDNNPYIKSNRARAKVRQWFNVYEHEERIAEGHASWLRMQSRLRPAGRPAPSGEEVATALGFSDMRDFYLAMSRGDVGMHQLQALVRGVDVAEVLPSAIKIKKSSVATQKKLGSVKTKNSEGENTAEHYSGKISILDMGGLHEQKASCCQPAPPTPIIGYITRQNVVSVHRADCHELWTITNRFPERVIAVAWQKNSSPPEGKSSVNKKQSKTVVKTESTTQTGLTDKSSASSAQQDAKTRSTKSNQPSANQKKALPQKHGQVLILTVEGNATGAAMAHSPPFLAQVLSFLQEQSVVISAMHYEQEGRTERLSLSLLLDKAMHAAVIKKIGTLSCVHKVKMNVNRSQKSS